MPKFFSTASSRLAPLVRKRWVMSILLVVALAGGAAATSHALWPPASEKPVIAVERQDLSQSLPEGSIYKDSRTGYTQRIVRNIGDSVVIIGDSQAAGAGNVTGKSTWPCLGFASLGYNVLNYAVGGTGYVAVSRAGKSYADGVESGQVMLPYGRAVARPPLVVIEGGGNDAGQGVSDARILANATRLMKDVKTLYPRSMVVMIGVLAKGTQNDGGRRAQVDTLLGNFAKEHKIPFISTGDWVTKYDVREKMLDRVHLNAEGHRIIAAQLTKALSNLGIKGPQAAAVGL